jgi:hypothetical protein
MREGVPSQLQPTLRFARQRTDRRVMNSHPNWAGKAGSDYENHGFVTKGLLAVYKTTASGNALSLYLNGLQELPNK